MKPLVLRVEKFSNIKVKNLFVEEKYLDRSLKAFSVKIQPIDTYKYIMRYND